MTALTRPIRRLLGRDDRSPETAPATAAPRHRTPRADRRPRWTRSRWTSRSPIRCWPTSSRASGPVELAKLELDSPAVADLRAAGVALVVPLVSQGELIGTLNLGPRLSEQDYSTDDRRLLTTLAAQAAPAIRVAQLVREQAHEAAERERLEQEMRVATLIQQQFLPRELPNLPEWQIAAYYGPARAVGGDFYDFIEMPGGRIGIAVGDVTDKGVPGRAGHGPDPFDPARRGQPKRLSGRDPRPRQRAAGARDAGPDVRDLPVRRSWIPRPAGSSWPMPATTCRTSAPRRASSNFARRGCRSASCRTSGMRRRRASSLRATACCCTRTAWSKPTIRRSEMYGFPRLAREMDVDDAGSELLDRLLDTLHAFTGPDWEQEDDITLVTLRRASGVADARAAGPRS